MTTVLSHHRPIRVARCRTLRNLYTYDRTELSLLCSVVVCKLEVDLTVIAYDRGAPYLCSIKFCKCILVTVISENIKEQMTHRMEADENVVYDINCELPEDNFQQIAENQTFYQNQNGQMVIVFNEYEVAPGFMGCPEFVIGDAVLKPLLTE